MKKFFSALALLTLLAPSVKGADWFETNTPLTQVHRYLLNKDLEAMYNALVEVWQHKQSKSIKSHINRVFLQSLEVDCGKGLSSEPLPVWLRSVTISQQSAQSPGRDTFTTSVDIDSLSKINQIQLLKWVDKKISNDSEGYETIKGDAVNKFSRYGIRYNLAGPLEVGLYSIQVTLESGESWNQWLIFSDQALKQSVRWAAKDKWRIEKNALLNPYCPLPKLEVALYDYVDGKYTQVWGKEYESEYPSQLEAKDIEPDRYVIAVSIKQSRWQGPILFVRSQIISKTLDVSPEE
ncbi:DUF2861 family protein [Vibrio sp. ZSDZ34]|uniref:DUF2861 family protein n=1 Tax=Vibrio gelatinilyticus TaxID=2893468 RepID=A0A9X2AYW3_9VIBR|nr:DUF2861 family protein [Vibrio gelatinilyticus]MCJ2377157.1 DUF2861 family protein [Vibrio gelatinilyticus]